MSTITEVSTLAGTTAGAEGSVRPRTTRAARQASRLRSDPAQLDQPTPSTATGIIFDVVLFFAAALSLIAVIHQMNEPETIDPAGVDAPAPALFVNEG